VRRAGRLNAGAVHADTTVDMHEADVRNEELIGERRGRLLEPLSRAERLGWGVAGEGCP
jgi:hypothetical protein